MTSNPPSPQSPPVSDTHEGDEAFTRRMEAAFARDSALGNAPGDEKLAARVWEGIQAGMVRQERDAARDVAQRGTALLPPPTPVTGPARALFLAGVMALAAGFTWLFLARSL